MCVVWYYQEKLKKKGVSVCVCGGGMHAWRACFSSADKVALHDSNLIPLSWHSTHTHTQISVGTLVRLYTDWTLHPHTQLHMLHFDPQPNLNPILIVTLNVDPDTMNSSWTYTNMFLKKCSCFRCIVFSILLLLFLWLHFKWIIYDIESIRKSLKSISHFKYSEHILNQPRPTEATDSNLLISVRTFGPCK